MELISNATFTDQIEITEDNLHDLDFSKVKISSTGKQDYYEKIIDELPKF